ncbi:15546_t:CDS:2 [Racocetra persica]|uniref:15546_t:CDS:1 n=1 Tax=Racocetra persica TaxID=160502 RepID=A0ACA9QJU1_9GLOM|nr:15546_t:CDS:2 [Racocetra persica]
MDFNTFDEMTPMELMETELENLIQQYTINGIQTEVQKNTIDRISDRMSDKIVDENPVANETVQTVTKIEIFDTWDQVENFFAKYSTQNGFSINKYRNRHSKTGVIYKRTFFCKFSKKYKAKKDHKAAQKETQYESRNQIEITTFVNKHNHKLFSETQEFRIKYRSLSKEALEEIKIMTKHANLLVTVQRKLLKA